MKTLLILRHAKSSWKQADLADHDRPLNKRGLKAAPRMGQLLKEEGLLPHFILSSTALRARETARLAAGSAGYEGSLHLDSNMYLASPSQLIRVVKGVDDAHERVMIVAHNPGMEELVEQLTGRTERFVTAALAQVELPIDAWRELSDQTRGSLIQLWRPRELDT